MRMKDGLPQCTLHMCSRVWYPTVGHSAHPHSYNAVPPSSSSRARRTYMYTQHSLQVLPGWHVHVQSASSVAICRHIPVHETIKTELTRSQASYKVETRPFRTYKHKIRNDYCHGRCLLNCTHHHSIKESTSLQHPLRMLMYVQQMHDCRRWLT